MPYEVGPNLNHYYPAQISCKLCGLVFIAMIPDGQQIGVYLTEKNAGGESKRKCPRCVLGDFAGQINLHAEDVYFFEVPEWEDPQ